LLFPSLRRSAAEEVEGLAAAVEELEVQAAFEKRLIVANAEEGVP
jgi:hypothetical protein